jgi:flagellar assembly protein FliH
MPSISKFLFETSFDGPGKGAAPVKAVRRNFTAAELEAEKGKAFAEGHKAGVTETTANATTRATVAFEKIAAHLAGVLGQMEGHRVESNKIAVGTAIAIMKKLLPALAQKQAAAEIETMITECLARMHDAPKIVIRLNDAHVEAFRERLEALATAAGFSGRAAVVAEPRLALEDARVEWADGGAERNTAQIWQEIEAAIQRFAASDQ